MPEPRAYSRTQVALHWIVAALIVPQMLFDDAISQAFRQTMQGQTPTVGLMVWAHIVPGITILLLVLWRLSLRATIGVPEAPGEPGLQRTAGSVVHWLIYAMLIALPVTGLAAWFGGVGTAGQVHSLLQNVLLALIILHVLAALWHQFGLKDNLIARMK